MSQYTKQEQEPASGDIAEVAPGILRLQLPISMPGLGHVNCYALEDGNGFALVDPGLANEESFHHLVTRLDAAGIPIERVHTAIVTHSHPDHFGGVYRLRQVSNCEVLTHQDFRSLFDRREAEQSEDSEDLALASDEDLERMRSRWTRPTPWGGVVEPPPVSELRRFIDQAPQRRRLFALPEPSRTVDDEDVVMFARREWVAVHTPGHTGDHLCLYDPTEGVLLSGDHVLPTITPHISGMVDAPDPLAQFFESLRRMHTLDSVEVVLPAHGQPFADLGGRADAIIAHHLERLDVIRDAADDFPTGTVDDFMKVLFKERSWGSMAASETYAHLEHLLVLGEVGADVDDHGMRTYEFL
ncbi:MAG: MBL fold metallo-hydrolase [Acidimicrobiales bacterium]|nr:MBL fold metallo-hydrolase [Acidimicrobiales bacterium]